MAPSSTTQTDSPDFRATAARHIVDVLIEERAPRFSAHWSWPIIKPVTDRQLGYAKAIRMADAIADLPGRDALNYISTLLQLEVATRHLDRVPTRGRLVVIANHPSGVGDGIAVFDVLKGRRPDVCFLANADAHRVCPRFDDVLIPVEWVYAKRTIEKTKRTLRMAQAAFQEERPLMIFPAGRIARRQQGKLIDRPWEVSAVTLARKHRAPIVPIHVRAPNSFWFHFFNRFSPELRDITLFHELLNKAGKRFDLIVGPLIPPEDLAGEPQRITERLKTYVESSLPMDPDQSFRPERSLT